MRCDKTEPQCLKCQKKGIQCSGQGLRCRFSSHMNVPALPVATSKSTHAVSKRQAHPASSKLFFSNTHIPRTVMRRRATLCPRAIAEETPGLPPTESACSTSSSKQLEGENPIFDVQVRGIKIHAAIADAVPAQVRMFFDHCTFLSLVLRLFTS